MKVITLIRFKTIGTGVITFQRANSEEVVVIALPLAL